MRTTTSLPIAPAEMLFNKRIRSGLPLYTKTLRPSIKSGQESLSEARMKQKVYYDRGTRPLPDLGPGDKAYVRTGEQQEWRSCTIVDQHTAPRSYIVYNGTIIVRCNHSHPKPATQPDIEPGMPASGPTPWKVLIVIISSLLTGLSRRSLLFNP